MTLYASVKITHVKTHGALNSSAAENAEYAFAIDRAVKVVDSRMIDVALAGSKMEKAGRNPIRMTSHA